IADLGGLRSQTWAASDRRPGRPPTADLGGLRSQTSGLHGDCSGAAGKASGSEAGPQARKGADRSLDVERVKLQARSRVPGAWPAAIAARSTSITAHQAVEAEDPGGVLFEDVDVPAEVHGQGLRTQPIEF